MRPWLGPRGAAKLARADLPAFAASPGKEQTKNATEARWPCRLSGVDIAGAYRGSRMKAG